MSDGKEAKVRISLFSTLKREGFVEADKSIKAVGKTATDATAAMGGVFNEVQQMDGALGKVAGGVAKVGSAFQQLGMIGGVVAGVQIALDSWVNHMKDAAEKMVDIATKAAAKAKDRLQNAITARAREVDESLKNTVGLAEAAIRRLDRLAAAQAKISQANAQLDMSRGEKTIADIQIEKLNRMIREQTEAGKAMVAAQYDVKIAEEKYAQAVTQGEAQRRKAEAELDHADERRLELESKVAEAKSHLAVATQAEADAAVLDAAAQKQFAAKRELAENLLAQAEEELANQQAAVKVAESNLEAVSIETSRRRDEANAQIAQTKAAEAELARAAKEQAEKLEERRLLEDELYETNRQYQTKMEELTATIADAKRKQEEIIKSQENTKSGMERDKARSSQTGREYDYQTDANGNVAAFEDWQRAQRWAERQKRDNARADRAAAQGEKQLDDLRRRRDEGENLSERERKRLEDLEKWDSERKGTMREDERIRKATEEMQKLDREHLAVVKDIRKRIDALTIK